MNEKLKKLKDKAQKLFTSSEVEYNIGKYKQDISLLIEEISISQIELELQNDQLQATQQLMELEKIRFTDLFINAPIGYLKLDESGIILDFNAEALRIFGLSPILLKNKSFISFIDQKFEDDYIQHQQTVFKSQQLQQDQELELVAYDSKHEKKFLKLRSNLLIDGFLDKKYMRTIVEDITFQKKAEREILQLNQRIEASMSAGNLAWWELELPSGKVFFNQNKAQMLGFPTERFKHYTDFTKLVHPEDYENTMDAFRKHLNGELPVYQCKYRIQNSENNYVWFYDVGKIVAQNIENIRITGIVINISEQMKFEQYMTENNATKDKLISILTHDLKNPFDSIVAYSELLNNNFKEFSPEKLENTIKTIFEITKNTHNLLENLLVWTHLQSDKIKYSPQILNLNELINENYNLFTPNLLAKNIAFENHTSQLLNLFVDKTTINLVLKNILSNAIKFTNSGGKIQIFTQQINDLTVEIRISDSGIGIPENILKNLFKIEKSFSSHGTDNEVGTGLGLILTNEFIKNNAGKINIKSKEGNGTEVYLQLPLYNKVSSFDHLSSVYNTQFLKKIFFSLENNLPAFLHHANTELFPIWEDLNQSISIEKIEIAKNKLFHLAHQFNSSLLLELANEIQNSLMNFSINEIYFFIKFFMQMKKEFEN